MQPVIYGDQYDAIVNQVISSMGIVVTRALHKTPTMNVHHDWFHDRGIIGLREERELKIIVKTNQVPAYSCKMLSTKKKEVK